MSVQILVLFVGWLLFSGLFAYLGDFARSRKARAVKLLGVWGMAGFSFSILYLALIWPQCKGSAATGDYCIVSALSVAALVTLAGYWGAMFYPIKTLNVLRPAVLLFLSAFIAAIRFAYLNAVPVMC